MRAPGVAGRVVCAARRARDALHRRRPGIHGRAGRRAVSARPAAVPVMFDRVLRDRCEPGRADVGIGRDATRHRVVQPAREGRKDLFRTAYDATLSPLRLTAARIHAVAQAPRAQAAAGRERADLAYVRDSVSACIDRRSEVRHRASPCAGRTAVRRCVARRAVDSRAAGVRRAGRWRTPDCT